MRAWSHARIAAVHIAACSQLCVLIALAQTCTCGCAQAAGGMSHDGSGSILDAVIRDTGDRSIIALGTRSMVTQCLDALRDGGST